MLYYITTSFCAIKMFDISVFNRNKHSTGSTDNHMTAMLFVSICNDLAVPYTCTFQGKQYDGRGDYFNNLVNDTELLDICERIHNVSSSDQLNDLLDELDEKVYMMSQSTVSEEDINDQEIDDLFDILNEPYPDEGEKESYEFY